MEKYRTKIKIRENPPPSGGWVFEDKDREGKTVKLKASSYTNLLSELLMFRLKNKLDTRCIPGILERHFIENHPDIVSYPKIKREEKSKIHSSGDKLYNFAVRVYNSEKPTSKISSEEESHARAKVCVGCMYNKSPNFTCGSCKTETGRLLAEINDGRKTKYDNHLDYCDKLGIDIKTAVHLNDDTLGDKSTDRTLPHNCWRRKK